MRPLIARISTKAIMHNLQRAKELCITTVPHNGQHQTPQVAAVLKANAYGHGLIECALAIDDQVDYLAVCSIDEALALRQGGIRCSILLLEGLFTDSEITLAQQHACIPVIHSLEWMHRLLASEYTGELWLKANTGMHRLGMSPQAWHQALALVTCKHTLVAMHHFACADIPNSQHALSQNHVFKKLTSTTGLTRSGANSAVICARAVQPPSHWLDTGEIIRPGIMLYGASPFGTRVDAKALSLLPTMRLESALIAVNLVTKGECVGYGAIFCAPTDGYIGIVACGYGDGYPRECMGTNTNNVSTRFDANTTYVWCAGAARMLVGRVSMDMLAIWLGEKPLPVGTKVCLWGDKPSVDEVANWAGTISYTLLAGLAHRVTRQFE